MILRILAALCLLVAALDMPSAVAQQRKAALVIGNGAYQHAPALPNPPNDARAVAEAFRKLGFDVTLVVDADRRQMVDALNRFGGRLDGGIGAFYFAGHAISAGGENYLLPVDAALKNEAAIRTETVGLDRVFDALDRASDGKIFILDANRDNPLAANLAHASRAGSVMRGLADVQAPPGSIFLMASMPGTVAADGAGANSQLTSILLKHVTEPGSDVETAMRRVWVDVGLATQLRQLPWLRSKLTSKLNLSDPRQSESAPAVPKPEPSAQVDEATPSPPASRTVRRYWYRPPSPEEQRRDREQRAAAERAERAEQQRIERERQTAAKRAEVERQAALTKAEHPLADPPAPLPEPPPPLPSAAASDQVARFPTIEAPDRVVAGATTTVLVSLTVDKITPEVKVLATGGGATKTAEGALSLPMPADTARMEVKVVLRAAGFDLDPATPEEATIDVGRGDDSTVARFRITARPDAVGIRSLRVTLWRDNEFLANVSRKIEIVPARPVASEQSAPSGRTSAARTAPPAPKALAAPQAAIAMDAAKPLRLSADAQVAVLRRPRPIDLKIEIVYDDAGGLGRGRVTIATDYLGRMRHGEINTPPSIVGWLEEFYREFRNLSSRGAQSADVPDDDTREARIGRLRAFGEELYRRAAPPVLKAALAELLDNPLVELRTVQIYSNNPVIPWELMRAPKAGGGSTDFFGITFALARWHEDDEPRMILRPPQDQRIDEVVAVAPAYSGGQSLGAQSREIEQIQALLATRRVSGKRSDFMSLMRNPPRGVIHFAGHGEIAGRSAVERRFAIRLEDGAFDVMDWRGVAGGQNRERALFFFNACDIGQAESVAGAVEGWAPAVLARGAAGYIGGLWPLKDDPAARFAVAFYGAVAKRLAENGEASVAGALSDARKLFYETADPTYLGYAFYGDAQLALVRRQ
ncbi:MAG: caspase family protein [Xanthobacteraceae bacterium]